MSGADSRGRRDEGKCVCVCVCVVREEKTAEWTEVMIENGSKKARKEEEGGTG